VSGVGKINIHASHDDAFRNSCWSDHPEVAGWLLSLYGRDEDGEDGEEDNV